MYLQEYLKDLSNTSQTRELSSSSQTIMKAVTSALISHFQIKASQHTADLCPTLLHRNEEVFLFHLMRWIDRESESKGGNTKLLILFRKLEVSSTRTFSLSFTRQTFGRYSQEKDSQSVKEKKERMTKRKESKNNSHFLFSFLAKNVHSLTSDSLSLFRHIVTLRNSTSWPIPWDQIWYLLGFQHSEISVSLSALVFEFDISVGK